MYTELSPNLEAPRKERHRITRACDFCRRKKIKCYLIPGQACSNCISYGVQCEFNADSKKRGPPKGYIDALEKRIQKIENAMGGNQDRGQALDSNRPHTGKLQLQYGFASKRSQGASSDRLQYVGELSPLHLFHERLSLDKKIMTGKQIRTFGQQIVISDNNPEMACLPNVPFIINRPCGVNHWVYSVTGVDKQTSDRLLKIYFTNVHPVMPVVNKTAFLKQYRDQTDTYPAAELLNTMFGTAARFMESEAAQQKQNNTTFVPPEAVWDVPSGWSEQFFTQASDIISEHVIEPSLSKVQAMLLIQHHSKVITPQSSVAWLVSGMMIRLAQALGLNRTPKDWDIPDDEKETRKRVWWSIYITDRFQAACFGRPIALREEDSDVECPNSQATWKEILDEPDEDEEDPPMPRFPSATYTPESTKGSVEFYQLFLQLIKLSEIFGRILQGLYTPKARKISYEQGSDAIVTRLDHDLTVWRFEFQRELKNSNFADFDEEKGYFSPAIAFILQCYFCGLILLHRPFIERAESRSEQAGKPSYSAFRISTSAAIRGTRMVCHMSPRDFLMFPYFFTFYPTIQFCLIHMYNSRSTDARVSTAAKGDLRSIYCRVKSLRKNITKAKRVHDLLRLVIEKFGIAVDEPTQELKATDGKHSRDVVEPAPDCTAVNDSTLLPFPQSSASSFRHSGDINAIQTEAQTPSLNANVPLINTKIEGQQSSGSSPSSLIGAEAFTLKQFGFLTPGDPTQLDYTLQDISAFSEVGGSLPPLPIYNQSFDNISSTLATVNSQQRQQQQQTTTSLQDPSLQQLFDAMPLSQQPATSSQPSLFGDIAFFQPTISDTQVSGPSQAEAPGNVFRNNPNNPFWDIPSSMDWDEWSAWNLRIQSSATWKYS